jgi:8-oxo-dGTP pyrophosphatase MutT (NUDIX family)
MAAARATSKYPTQQYTAEELVESCGAIPFLLSKRQIYLVHYVAKEEWLLAKGRRDCHESRREAALREVREETGLNCHLLPLTMATRAPGPGLDVNAKDEARVYENLVEPFMYTLRQLPPGEGVKMIFWFVAAVDENNPVANAGEASYKVAAFDYEEAMNKLTYDNDRRIVAQAIELVERSQQRT